MYVVADRGLNGLSFNTFHFNAGNGKNGGSTIEISTYVYTFLSLYRLINSFTVLYPLMLCSKVKTLLPLLYLHYNPVIGDGLTGKRGGDVYIRVPLGTIVTEQLSSTLQDFIVRTLSLITLLSHLDILFLLAIVSDGRLNDRTY